MTAAQRIVERLRLDQDFRGEEDYQSEKGISVLPDPVWTISFAEISGRYDQASLKVGEIYGDRWDRDYGSGRVAQCLIVGYPLPTVLHILELSPFWISYLAANQNGVFDQVRLNPPCYGICEPDFHYFLALYRLVEICLAAIDQFPDAGSKKLAGVRFLPDGLRGARVLLLRQRFLYLSLLVWFVEQEEKAKADFGETSVRHYLPGLNSLVRLARREYAGVLLDEEEQVALAFSRVDCGGQPWDLDQEAALLLYAVQLDQDGEAQLSDRLCAFARNTMQDSLLTDMILRRWFLAHDDLAGVARAIRQLVQGPQDGGGLAAWLAGQVDRIYAWLGIGLVLLLLAGMATTVFPGHSALFDWLAPLPGLMVGLVFPVLISVTVVARSKTISRQALYPLALRIPAMGLVGVLAMSGLADPLVKFGFNALAPQVWGGGLFLTFVSLAAAFLYTFFEAHVRSGRPGKALKRAGQLWGVGWISTLWLAVVNAALADVIGLTACDPGAYTLTPELCVSPGVLVFHSGFFLWGMRFSLDYILVMSAMALLVGVFTQIFWEDKAIAEPL